MSTSTRASRIPFDDEYVRELGEATYIFSYLEWGVVCSIDHLEPGYVNTNKGTAGTIADKFVSVAASSTLLSASALSEVQAASARFKVLVVPRNMLVHGNPYTPASGNQQLLYNGKSGWKEWSIADIQSVASEFEELAIEVNRLFHLYLRPLRPQSNG